MSDAATTVVPVHGAWTDASSWDRVIPILLDERQGDDAAVRAHVAIIACE
jgi:hypothetical protein